MTLGFGGFEDPAVIPSMYVVWLQKWPKEKEIPKKGKKKNFFKAHRLAAARILHWQVRICPQKLT